MKRNWRKILSLLVICTLVMSLAACGSSSKIKTGEEVRTALKDAGWTIETDDSSMAGVYEGVSESVYATKDADYVSFFIFDTADHAKKAFDILNDPESTVAMEIVKESGNYKHVKLVFLGMEMHSIRKDNAFLTYGTVPDNIKNLPSMFGMD